MKNDAFADEIIARLNDLLKNADTKRDISVLVETRIPCSQTTLDHPTIQAGWATDEDEAAGIPPQFGMLGVLNGLIGIDPELTGARTGWGYITAEFDDNMSLVSFSRTKNQ
jgi:hypothetical protein